VFGIFASHDRKMRANAGQWIELAEKVFHYRRDVLSGSELQELQKHTADLRQLLRNHAETSRLKLAIESLEEVLRRLGGTHYPKSSLVENVEFFLVAAIIILGFRAYFIQPFKIPTNSMWPSYYGMTAENFLPNGDAPGIVNRLFRMVAFGAQRREATAPKSGSVSADFFENGEMAYTIAKGHNWLVLPTTVREYTFYVDGEPAKLTVPLDFHKFDEIVRETFFEGIDGLQRYLKGLTDAGTEFPRGVISVNPGRHAQARVLRIPLSRHVEKGDPVLRFDIMTGDQLFVDRLSYHFVRPSVGQGFVFRTGLIDSPHMKDQQSGRQIDQYYVKRLVGRPGDTLEIKDYTLYRNGQPITGAAAFAKNARREEHYVGYQNQLSLAEGRTMTVPKDHFLALGDNSENSMDGRYWGYVPAESVVGRPIFIYYPFTNRWGPAR